MGGTIYRKDTALIHGALHSLKNVISNETIDLIKNKICQTISEFLDKALQLDKADLDSEKKSSRYLRIMTQFET